MLYIKWRIEIKLEFEFEKCIYAYGYVWKWLFKALNLDLNVKECYMCDCVICIIEYECNVRSVMYGVSWKYDGWHVLKLYWWLDIVRNG